MKKVICSRVAVLFLFLLFAQACLAAPGKKCKPRGILKGKKPPNGKCKQENNSDCCKEGKRYTTYKCSLPVTSHTKAILTLNSSKKGGDGVAPAACDGKYHSDETPVVALSTGWSNKRKRCHNKIKISANGHSVVAKVVDECDLTMGCDLDHDSQPPCPNNIVDASIAVWKALHVPECDQGWMEVVWSEV